MQTYISFRQIYEENKRCAAGPLEIALLFYHMWNIYICTRVCECVF